MIVRREEEEANFTADEHVRDKEGVSDEAELSASHAEKLRVQAHHLSLLFQFRILLIQSFLQKSGLAEHSARDRKVEEAHCDPVVAAQDRVLTRKLD